MVIFVNYEYLVDFVYKGSYMFGSYIKYILIVKIIKLQYPMKYKRIFNFFKIKKLYLRLFKYNKFTIINLGVSPKQVLMYNFFIKKLTILKCIQLGLICLDFNSMVNISPILENIIQNEVFDVLGIEGVNDQENIYVPNIIIDNPLSLNKPKVKEVLNYQSNVLYVLINGLSPSIY